MPRRIQVEVSPAPARLRVWDLPTRIFHWSLAVLVVFSFVTGKAGGSWLEWHMRSGYAILALLAFRVAWGFAGGTHARFASFVRGPGAALAYARALLHGKRAPVVGHNPLGAWMVLFLLGALLLQAATGLFADDEIATQGPLAVKASEALVARMTTIHRLNEWVIVGAAALHVAAVATYQWGLKVDLLGPMVHGWKAQSGEIPVVQPRPASPLLAAAIAGGAAALVYWLVVVYPRA